MCIWNAWRHAFCVSAPGCHSICITYLDSNSRYFEFLFCASSWHLNFVRLIFFYLVIITLPNLILDMSILCVRKWHWMSETKFLRRTKNCTFGTKVYFYLFPIAALWIFLKLNVIQQNYGLTIQFYYLWWSTGLHMRFIPLGFFVFVVSFSFGLHGTVTLWELFHGRIKRTITIPSWGIEVGSIRKSVFIQKKSPISNIGKS